MTLHKNAQVRADLNAADRVVRACWGNFIATEPTYVLRDLIVIEIQNARDAERERCTGIVNKLAGADAVYPARVEMLLEAIRNPIN